MVEGPGCTLNGERLKKRGVGQQVKAVSGTTASKQTKCEGSPYDILLGMTLTDVKTLGKELFAFFEKDVCIRMHFLMNGSLRFMHDNRPVKKDEQPLLIITLTSEEVTLYEGNAQIRSSEECQQRYKDMQDVDICTSNFNAVRATNLVMDHPDRLVCDVILDQLVMPGVGNIIKNEALFNAGINPNAKVKELSKDLIAHLVKMNRDFTNIFYDCRKNGKNLQRHFRVYNKTQCVQCKVRLIKCKPGELVRPTFFCPSCQINTTMPAMKKINNSMLGWVGSKEQSPWICQACTLENKPANNRCAICLTPRIISKANPSKTCGTPPTKDLSTTFNETQENCNLKRKHPGTPEVQVGKFKFRMLSKSPPDPSKVTSTPNHTLLSQEHTVKTNQSNNLSQTPSYIDSSKDFYKTYVPVLHEGCTGLPKGAIVKNILCSGHKQAAKKNQVHKNNENKGRIFYSCSRRQGQSCNFFQWADDHHPKCHCGKITVERQSLKQNHNNMRPFFCCSGPRSKQCNFFVWADQVNKLEKPLKKL
ncbi:unnamed protein product, partial [Meganyctiphanes norvegica]